MEKEFEKSGRPNGQTWEQFVEKSRSIMADVYRDKQHLLGLAMHQLWVFSNSLISVAQAHMTHRNCASSCAASAWLVHE